MTLEEKEAMSLKRLIKTFDPKKIFLVKYKNKKVMIKRRLLQMENIVTITLLYLTLLGNIEMTSFEIPSKESCESWYHHNVKVTNVNNVRCLLIMFIMSMMVNRLLDMFVEMIHHNN